MEKDKLNIPRRILTIGILFLLLDFFQLTCPAEVIVIKGGAEVTGTILKSDEKFVIVDIGFDVLRIPRPEILKIGKEKSDTPQAPDPVRISTNNLYTVKAMEETSTVINVSTFAPAVVIVTTPAGMGSGFLINSRGFLVTNFHVIREQRNISVTRLIKSGAELKRVIHKNVRIVALDPFHDLAVLQLKEKPTAPFTPVILGSQSNPDMGEKIFIIGNPLGLERTVTEGVVSHTARNFGGKLFLQVDASVNPGNSGGPLFNSRGQVIGVINMGVRAMQGLNFAIPVHHVTYLLDHIDAYAFNEANPLSGYVYSTPPANPRPHAQVNNDKKKTTEEHL